MNNYKASTTSEFRQIPFWSLNDLLTESEMRRQVNEFGKAGFGGYFLHSRIGLVTPYMKDEWMKTLAAAIDEGRKLGLEPWLYDEDKWPSGYAGGEVPEKRVENRLKYIMCIPENFDDIIIEKSSIGNYYPFKSKEDVREQLKSSVFLKKIKGPDGDYSLYIWTLPWGDKPLNGSCYVDLMNPQTVQDFIDSTYEKYKKEFGAYFGNLIPGIFTDEPSAIYPWPNIPFKFLHWTQNFDIIFEELNSYKIIDHFEELFFETGEFYAVRYDYYKTLAKMFIESYSKKIYDWCTKNNLIFTGHYLGEDNLLVNFICSFSTLRTYEYETYPGMDALGEKISEFLNYTMMKQVSSVAEQLGKKRVLSETYGGAGWNMTIENQKLIADTQLILGINFFTPHLAHYSLRGERKRDYPASIFYQQPYWYDYKIYNDYLNHLCTILTQGKRELNILFVHPIESLWVEYTPFDKNSIMKRDNKFLKFSDELIKHQKDYHFVDEDILSRYGKIENGKLVIGDFTYGFIILLEPATIRKTTLDFLNNIFKNESEIYFIDSYPKYIDGRIANKDFSGFAKIDNNVFLENIDKYLPQKFTISGDREKIILHWRKIGDDEICYLMNTDVNSPADFDLVVQGNNDEFEKIVFISGDTERIPNDYTETSVKVSLKLAPSETILLKKSPRKSLPLPKVESVSRDIVKLSGNWRISDHSLNSLPLDNCKLTVSGVENEYSCNIIFAKNILKEHYQKKVNIQYEFFIQNIDKIKNEIYFVSEPVKSQQIVINNRLLLKKSEGWWTDISFQKYPIKEYLKEGMNIVNLEVIAYPENEYEAVYIIGEFDVRSDDKINYKISPIEIEIKSNDLTENGYPFFSGKIKLRRTFNIDIKRIKKVNLKYDSSNAIAHNIFINSQYAGNIIWQPYSLEITDLLRDGENEITCELVSSLRNLLGPLHNTNYHPVLVGPEQFDNIENWSDCYTLINFGLPDNLRLEYY
jgi:hypothetical protein